MARPKKQTIDYFPHYVNGGKTKLILQNEFGNDGYAFWFKLLELLCRSESQVYDYNNSASWRFLLAETHVSEDIAVKILQLLADLSAIDSELHRAKIIWSQNLVENLELVYRRRLTGTPIRPVIANINPVSAGNNRQTILNNTKQNNTILPEWLNKETWDAFVEMRRGKKSLPTERAKSLLIKELERLKLAGDDPNAVLDRSIMNSWKGVFPLDKQGGRNGTNQRNPRALPTVYTRPEDL